MTEEIQEEEELEEEEEEEQDPGVSNNQGMRRKMERQEGEMR